MLQLLRGLVLLPLSLASASCVEARPAHPALWKVSSPTSTIYFLGTIHALPKGEDWHTPAIIKAEAEADTLVLELSDGADHDKITSAINALAFAPNLPDVLDRVPANKRAKVEAVLAHGETPLAALKNYKTWAVFFFAINPQLFKTLGVDGDEGVEHKLTADFTAAHKQIDGLETVRSQLGIFDALPEALQRRLLVESIDDIPRAKAEFYQSLRAWEAGDPAAIARSFDTDLKSEPQLARVLLHDRNANWAQWTIARLKKPGVTLVAVGAGHLAGNDSLLAMLRAKGLKIVRVG